MRNVGGTAAALYRVAMARKSNSFAPSQAEVRIGDDGQLRRQATDEGSVRYEFNDVAPLP
jgi:hypothetical protein